MSDEELSLTLENWARRAQAYIGGGLSKRAVEEGEILVRAAGPILATATSKKSAIENLRKLVQIHLDKAREKFPNGNNKVA